MPTELSAPFRTSCDQRFLHSHVAENRGLQALNASSDLGISLRRAVDIGVKKNHSGDDLGADFATLVGLAVNVDVQLAGLVTLELFRVELGSCRH